MGGTLQHNMGGGGTLQHTIGSGTLQHSMGQQQMQSTCRASMISRSSKRGRKDLNNTNSMTLQRTTSIAPQTTMTLQRGGGLSLHHQQHLQQQPQQQNNSYDQPNTMLTLDNRRRMLAGDLSDHSKDELRDVTSL